jgi:uncharacterized protein
MKTAIKQYVIEINRHADVWLFGSRARNEAKNDSDWDVLVLTDDETVTHREEEKYIDHLTSLMVETGEVIQVLVYSAKEWNTKYSIIPLHKSIEKEAIKL